MGDAIIIDPTHFYISESWVRWWLDYSGVVVLFPYLSRVVGWEPARVVDCERYMNEEGKLTKKEIGQLKQNRMSTRSPHVKSGSRVFIGNGIPSGAVGASTGLWASIIQVSNVADFWFLAWFLTGLLRARADGPLVVASCLSDFVTVV